MITKEDAVKMTVGKLLYHGLATNADGTRLRVRVTGKCKTWVRQPDRFQLPVKYGLRQSLYITERNCAEWSKD